MLLPTSHKYIRQVSSRSRCKLLWSLITHICMLAHLLC